MSVTQTQASRAQHAAGGARLVMHSEQDRAARQRLALRDILESFSLWRLALTLGWFDIRLRYRGSMLGPFLVALLAALVVGWPGILSSRLFKLDLAEYLPFMAISLVLWGVLSTVISEACTCFTS